MISKCHFFIMDTAKKEKSEMEEDRINSRIDLNDGDKKEQESYEEEERPAESTEIDSSDADKGEKEENGDSKRIEQAEKETSERGEQAEKKISESSEQVEKETSERGEQVEKENSESSEQAEKEISERGEQAEKEKSESCEQAEKETSESSEQAEKENSERGKQAEKEISERGEQAENDTDDELRKVIAQKEEHTVDAKADEVIKVNTKEREDETESACEDNISKGDDENDKDVKSVENDDLKDSNKSAIEDSEVTSNGFEVIPEDSLKIPFSHYVDHKNLTSTRGSDETERFDGENELVCLLKVYKQNNKDLKDFHRRNSWGTHHTIRGQLWVRVCETLHKAKGNLYDDYEKDLFHQRNSDDIALPSFVDFNNLTSYHLSEQGTKTVAKILAIIQNTNPEILYCPTLYAKLSILLHYMDPSDAFNCIYALLRSKDANIMQTKVAVEASKLVLRDLTKKYAKSAYVYLVRNSSDITSVFDSWMWWLFSDLPFPHIVRILDCYLVEGVKVLYRVVLSILILFTKFSVSAKQHGVINDSFTVTEKIHQFCTNMPFSVEKLLKKGFRIRGLTKKEIKKLQLRHEMAINSKHHLQHEIQKSASSHSFSVPHSQSFSGRIVFDHTKSSIVTNNEMLYAIWSWLPARFAVCQPELLYTSEEHGTSLRTLYTQVENHQPTLILIKTTTDEIFGAFCSMYWRERKKSNKNVYYFGTGETFVFTLSPERKKYEWVGLHEENIPNTANMFLAGDSKILTIGGGSGEAIQLDENLLHCRTEHCDTFDNPPLCSNQDFTCKVVEVYGFQ